MEECTYYANSCIINNPSAFAKENMIYLQEIGKQHLFSPVAGKNEKSSSYLFFMVCDGRGMLEYENDAHVIAAGYCAFLDCRKSYRYYPMDGVLEVEYILFSGFHMEEIYEEFMRNASPCFCSYSPQIYKEAWQQVYEIAAAECSGSIARDMEIYAALISLTTNLMKLEENVFCGRGQKKKSLQNVREYLEHHYWEKISLDQLSEMFYINKFYLTRLFREQYGISVNNYLIKIRISQAKKLLQSSDLPIEQIGLECGIGNTNYFFKVFKKWEGMSPGNFRKKEKCQEISEVGKPEK